MPVNHLLELELTGPAVKQIPELARKLKELDKNVAKEFRKALKKGTAGAVAGAKQAALNLPSQNKSKGASGLRRGIARSITSQISTSSSPRIGIRVSKTSLGPKGNLPKLMNKGSWRHPVWGKDVWVTQTSRAGWFDDEMRKHKEEVEKELKDTLDMFEKRLKV